MFSFLIYLYFHFVFDCTELSSSYEFEIFILDASTTCYFHPFLLSFYRSSVFNSPSLSSVCLPTVMLYISYLVIVYIPHPLSSFFSNSLLYSLWLSPLLSLTLSSTLSDSLLYSLQLSPLLSLTLSSTLSNSLLFSLQLSPLLSLTLSSSLSNSPLFSLQLYPLFSPTLPSSLCNSLLYSLNTDTPSGYAYEGDLNAVMKRDAINGTLRNFDGEMPDWKSVSSSLKKLSQRTLGDVWNNSHYYTTETFIFHLNSIEIILLSSTLSRYLSVWLCTSSLTTADCASLLFSTFFLSFYSIL